MNNKVFELLDNLKELLKEQQNIYIGYNRQHNYLELIIDDTIEDYNAEETELVIDYLIDNCTCYSYNTFVFDDIRVCIKYLSKEVEYSARLS